MLKDAFIKEIDILEGKLRYYRTTIIAMISAMVWSVYAIMEAKADVKILILNGIGLIFISLVIFRIRTLEVQEDDIIEKIKKELS